MDKHLKGLFIICCIFIFLSCFLAAVNYKISLKYNQCVEEYNELSIEHYENRQLENMNTEIMEGLFYEPK